jgi:hypothetical protein
MVFPSPKRGTRRDRRMRARAHPATDQVWEFPKKALASQ